MGIPTSQSQELIAATEGARGADVHIGRQPIFDRSLEVFAYELLFRGGPAIGPGGRVSGDRATVEVMLNAFTEFGLDRLLGGRYGCINLTERFVLGHQPLPFGPQQMILEILEDIPVTPQLVAAVTRLSKAGYIVALDDYRFESGHEALVSAADIVKLDITLMSPAELEEQVRVLKRFGVRLVAERVETMAEYEHCRDLGFDYFQGFFLSRPQVVSAQKLPTNRLAAMNLLAVLNDASADTQDLAEAINADMSISYRVLKIINSAIFNLTRTVESVQQAVVLIGRRKLAVWASLMVLSAMDDRPSELLLMAMVRAKMCELLAEAARLQPVESYFTVGLFSALDLLMERPLSRLLEPLPLSEELVAALLHSEGVLGEALACALAYETARWDEVSFKDLSSEAIAVANIEAVTWANGVIDSL